MKEAKLKSRTFRKCIICNDEHAILTEDNEICGMCWINDNRVEKILKEKGAKQERERILKIIDKWLNEIAIRQEGEPTISNSDYEELKKGIEK